MHRGDGGGGCVCVQQARAGTATTGEMKAAMKCVRKDEVSSAPQILLLLAQF